MYLFRYFYYKNVRAQNFIVIALNDKSSLQINENFATKVELCDREIWVTAKLFTIDRLFLI